MRTITLSLLITICTLAYGQPVPEFSTLSSTAINGRSGFHSLKIPDGILYYITKPDLSATLYKVNFEGVVVDSAIFNTDGYTYTGQLYTSNGRFFLIGNADKPFVSWFQSATESRRSIIEFDENLDIIQANRYDMLPSGPGLGLAVTVSVQTTVGAGSAIFQPLDAHHLKGDTMLMTREYIFFDTTTFLPKGGSQRLEKVVLNDSYYSVKSISQYIEAYKGAAILDDSIYVYASASECCAQALFDFTSVGVFNADGDWVRKIALLPQPNGLIDVAYDANGLYMNGKIFTSYTDVVGISDPLCEAAVIDIRNTKFNLLRLAKVPLCGFYPSGTKCFAELGNTIYFQTRNNDGDIGLCQYDTLLQLHWSQVYDFDLPHLGIAVNATPDGGCILESVTGQDQNILKLYKVNAAGNIVSFTSFPMAKVPAVKVYPNPFVDRISIEGLMEPGGLVEIYDCTGRLCQSATLANQQVQVDPALPPGLYAMTIRSRTNNRVLYSQKLVKQ